MKDFLEELIFIQMFVKMTGIIIRTLSFKLSLPWSTWGKDAHNSMDCLTITSHFYLHRA